LGENGYGGWVQCFFLFHFLGINIFAKFDLQIAKLVELTVLFFSISLSKNGEISPEKKDTGWMGA